MRTGWRTALRVAWREARRAKGRSALVVAMIALPVAALGFAAVSYDTFELSPNEQADRLMGAGDAVVMWQYDVAVHQEPDRLEPLPAEQGAAPGPTPTADRLLALLPAGSTAIGDVEGQLQVRTAAGIGSVSTRMLDTADPLARGIFTRLTGRAPRSAAEVALTPAASDRLGADVGDRVRLADGSRTFRVVGLVEDPEDLLATTIVLDGGALPASALSAGRPDQRWLVSIPHPLTWAQVKRLNTQGVSAVSRQVLEHPPSASEQYRDAPDQDEVPPIVMVLAGGMGVLQVVLLAGPAFAVGVRRRQRELALVAAAGGTPAHVRRIVLADGVVLGAAAGIIGVAVGIAVAMAGRPLAEELSHVRSGSVRFYPEALAVLAGVAVVTGTLAALVPAWISSRQDVVTALAGRRGITRSRRRWIVVGAALAVAGVAGVGTGAWFTEETAVLAGVVVAEFGLVLCTPAVVGLVARVGRWLPVAPRIALRNTSRTRTAAAPAISAVMAAVIASLALGVILTATVERDADQPRAGRVGDVVVLGSSRTFRPSEEISTSLRSTMPVKETHLVKTPQCADGPCFLLVSTPAEQACPYAFLALRRPPDSGEQRAARQDHRCDGVNTEYTYFGDVTSNLGMVVIVEPDGADAAADFATEDTAGIAAALRSGAIVVDDEKYLQDGKVTMAIDHLSPEGRPSSEPPKTVTAPGYVPPAGAPAPIALMTEQTATSLGLRAEPLVTVGLTSRVPTVAEEDRLAAALGSDYRVVVDRGDGQETRALLLTLLAFAIVSGIITLGAAAMATGLAAADGRADLATLAAVGASPRLRRSLSLSQSGVIAGLGSLLGGAAGLGLSIAVLVALNRGYADMWPPPPLFPLAMPWLNIAIALVVVPLVAMLGAGLLTRSRLPIERRL